MSEKIEVILIDCGSSVVKSAEVINGEFVNRKQWHTVEELHNHYKGIPSIISTVRKDQIQLSKMFGSDNTIVLDYKTPLPIQLDYDTPETLGPDRIALAVGANTLFPKQNNLIIDVGTCVTLDVVDEERVFRGGIIAPGLTTRMKAMSYYTSSLPDISNDWASIPAKVLGKSTKESLLAGSLNGLTHELKATIETIKEDFASINIILTGGDAKYFESRIKAHIFAGSKIVEIGLYRIWKHQ